MDKLLLTGDSMSVETGAKFIEGMTAFQFIVVLLVGMGVVSLLIWITRWLVDQKIGELPQDIKDIKRELRDIGRELMDIKLNQTRLEGKLWTREDVVDAIEQECQKEMRQHIENCPVRHKS